MANRSQTLDAPQVPTLPQPGDSYQKSIETQRFGLLRTFFLKIQNALSNVLGPNGGQYIDCPNGLFFNTSSQTLAAANTGYPVVFNQTYLNNGVTLANSSRITTSIAGVYNFAYAGQIESTNSSSKDVWLWLRRNGTNIGYSTHVYTISGSGTKLEISWNFDIDMQAGSYMEIVWGASDTNATLTASTASSPHPGISSSVLTVNFIAPLPDVIPTPP